MARREPDNGTTPASLVLTSPSSSLEPGEYSSEVSVRGPNNTLRFPVTLTVTGAQPPVRPIQAFPPSLSFVLETGSFRPPSSQTADYISNGPITFSARTLSGGDWLKTQTFANSLLTANATAVNLAPGTYTAEIVVW